MRAFIVTPFGVKSDAEGNLIDFDAVRQKLIEPALDELRLAGKTTGEIVSAGDTEDMVEQARKRSAKTISSRPNNSSASRDS
jgi:hypothetical protein